MEREYQCSEAQVLDGLRRGLLCGFRGSVWLSRLQVKCAWRFFPFSCLVRERNWVIWQTDEHYACYFAGVEGWVRELPYICQLTL
jgi:hypothetical protein